MPTDRAPRVAHRHRGGTARGLATAAGVPGALLAEFLTSLWVGVSLLGDHKGRESGGVDAEERNPICSMCCAGLAPMATGQLLTNSAFKGSSEALLCDI
uniref:Uncharacterized protein n=1 Tax=Knipowitschia caucasica TaxID=637954 RepID=A0AAV2IVM4_KNICA